MGRLDVRVVSARNLADTQWVSKPDPYCILRLERQQHKTTVKENNLNPEWNEVFKFTVADENSSQLVVEVWNKNVISDELMGTYKLSLTSLVRGVVSDQWYLLQNSKNNSEIRLRVMAHDFGKEPPVAQAVAPAAASSAFPQPFQSTGGQGFTSPPSVLPVTTNNSSVAPPINPMPMYGPPQTYAAPSYPQPSGYAASYGAAPSAGPIPYQQAAYGGAPPVSGGPYGGPPASYGYPQPVVPAPGQQQAPQPVFGVPLSYGAQPYGAPQYGSQPYGAQPYGAPQQGSLPPPGAAPLGYPQQSQPSGCYYNY